MPVILTKLLCLLGLHRIQSTRLANVHVCIHCGKHVD